MSVPRSVSGVIVTSLLLLLVTVPALATNGDNLISVGPTSRSMGGVGIASPQDAVSAVFSNPAAMCFGPFCPSSKIDVSTTFFIPHVKAKVERADGVFSETSKEKVYMIPAMGVSVPLSDKAPYWRLGLAAYGISGMGVNYRDTPMAGSDGFGFPRASGTFTELMRMKVAPSIAVRPTEWLSLGVSLHLQYASLNLDHGYKSGIAVGIQPGIIFKPYKGVSLGMTYVSPQKIRHHDISDLDGDGVKDHLDLESPQMFGFGASYEFEGIDLVLEANTRWYQWSTAKGYKDFDWNDQWVLGIGAQWRIISPLALRLGYNYGSNPVAKHDNFNGQQMLQVQGYNMPRYFYETFRVIGFPAIVEHHITCGLEWEVFEHFYLSASYVHAFSNKLSESGTDIYGRAIKVSSTLSENSFGLGLSYVF